MDKLREITRDIRAFADPGTDVLIDKDLICWEQNGRERTVTLVGAPGSELPAIELGRNTGVVSAVPGRANNGQPRPPSGVHAEDYWRATRLCGNQGLGRGPWRSACRHIDQELGMREASLWLYADSLGPRGGRFGKNNCTETNDGRSRP